MYKFGKRSRKNLSEAHPLLQDLFNEVIKIMDCSVTEGHRSKEEHERLYHAGKTTVKYQKSKHSKKPSMAVDVVPWPVDWNDEKQFSYFAGIVKGVAEKMGIKIRWGGDWNRNNNLKDQNFHDLPHFELYGKQKRPIS